MRPGSIHFNLGEQRERHLVVRAAERLDLQRIAGFLLPKLGIMIGGGIIAEIIDAAIGAIIVLVIVSFIRRA